MRLAWSSLTVARHREHGGRKTSRKSTIDNNKRNTLGAYQGIAWKVLPRLSTVVSRPSDTVVPWSFLVSATSLAKVIGNGGYTTALVEAQGLRRVEYLGTDRPRRRALDKQ